MQCLIVLIFTFDRIFKWMMKEFAEVHEQLLSDIKDALFDDLRQIESKVVDLRNKGVIRILEIGVGAGN